jgi:hypothetical protein
LSQLSGFLAPQMHEGKKQASAATLAPTKDEPVDPFRIFVPPQWGAKQAWESHKRPVNKTTK